MSYKIDIHPSNTLRISYSGSITVEEMKSVRENALAMVRTNRLEFIICDLQDAMIDVREMEIFKFTRSHGSLYKNIKKTAIIYTPDRHNVKDLNSYASMAGKKGFRIRVFSDGSEAIKWLKF